MNKSILLFTVSYPYGEKEQFLETEIEYLSECFQNVTVIPAFASGRLRPVPENVMVDSRFAEQNSIVHMAVSSLLTRHTYAEIYKHPSVLTSVKKLVKLAAFTGRGVALYRFLRKNYEAGPIYYSYWFNGAVFASYLYDRHVKHIDYVARVHGNDLYLERNGGYLPLRPTIFKTIKTVFAISSDGYDYLKHHYQLDDAKAVVSRLGTKPCGKHLPDALEKNSRFHIVSCAHMTPVKRIDLGIEAMAEAARQMPEIMLMWTHLGGGPDYPKIAALAKSVLPDNVQFDFKGNLENSEVISFYKNHHVDLFINTSRYEGIPVTIMEAMSCAIPVLAPDVGGISEIVNQDNGFLLEAHADAAMIADVLSAAVKDRDLLREKGENAKKFWEINYNAEKNYHAFCNALSGRGGESSLK